jgi:hypothetical protein
VVAFQIAAGDVIKEKVRAAVGVKVLEEPLFNVDLVVRQPLWRSAELTHLCSTKLTQWFKAGGGAFSFQVVEKSRGELRRG